MLWLRGRVERSPKVIAVGLVYAATLVLFVTSTKLTTAANAIFLQSTAPLYIAVLAPLLLGERFRARDLAFLGAAGAGLVLCVGGGSASTATATAPDPATGNLLGVLCSLSWAFTLLGLRWVELNQRGSGISSVVAGNVIAFLVGVPLLDTAAVSVGHWTRRDSCIWASFRSRLPTCCSPAPSGVFPRFTSRSCCSSSQC